MEPFYFLKQTAVPYAITSAAPCIMEAEEYLILTMASAPNFFVNYSKHFGNIFFKRKANYETSIINLYCN